MSTPAATAAVAPSYSRRVTSLAHRVSCIRPSPDSHRITHDIISRQYISQCAVLWSEAVLTSPLVCRPQDARSERVTAHVPLLRGLRTHQPVPLHERHPGSHLQQLQEAPEGTSTVRRTALGGFLDVLCLGPVLWLCEMLGGGLFLWLCKMLSG